MESREGSEKTEPSSNLDEGLKITREMFIKQKSQNIIFYKEPFLPSQVNYILRAVGIAERLDNRIKFLQTSLKNPQLNKEIPILIKIRDGDTE